MSLQTQIDTILSHNISEIFPSRKALREKLLSDDNLTFYLGIDPNVSDVHLGHAVVYKKLEQFRKLGHTVICLLGDFTARIGDPTDKTAARQKMTAEEVFKNAQAYKEQVNRVLSFEDPENPAQLKFNSEWLNELTFGDVIELASYFTVQQMIERDMYQQRLNEGKPIHLHEFLYPLMQGYDSVAMDVDVEIGGTDQTFNMLAGRNLMKALKNKEKFVITCPFLMGTDGQKMSKSTGNYISLRLSSFEMYRKVMTIHDDMIFHYFDIFLETDQETLQRIKKLVDTDPLATKKDLAFHIVAQLYNQKSAQDAADEFEKVVQKGELPDVIRSFSANKLPSLDIVSVLSDTNLVESNSEARRLIEQGAVTVNDSKVTDLKYVIKPEEKPIIRVGKARFIQIT